MFLPGRWTDLPLPQGTGQVQPLHCGDAGRGIYCGLLPDRRLCDDLPACIRVSPDMHNCCAGGLENGITRFFSNISMEIYLSHMVLFRVIERLGLNTRFGNGWLQYLITVVLILTATVIFSIVIMKKVIYVAEHKIQTLFPANSKASS